MPSHLSQSEKGGLHICLYFPLSTVFSVYLLQNEGGFDVCAYLAFSFSAVMPSYFSQSEKGVVLTCVYSWLSLCHVILLTSK